MQSETWRAIPIPLATATFYWPAGILSAKAENFGLFYRKQKRFFLLKKQNPLAFICGTGSILHPSPTKKQIASSYALPTKDVKKLKVGNFISATTITVFRKSIGR